MQTKAWYLSKTLWVNAVAFVALAIQQFTGLVVDAEVQVGFLAVLNFLLRLVTKQAVE